MPDTCAQARNARGEEHLPNLPNPSEGKCTARVVSPSQHGSPHTTARTQNSVPSPPATLSSGYASAAPITCPDVTAAPIVAASTPTAASAVLPNDANVSTAATSPPATPRPDFESIASAP